MKVFIIISISILFIGLTSCKKDQLSTSVEVFKFTTNENFILENERKWVLIYNQNNVLISEQELENNRDFEFMLPSESENSLYTVQLITTKFIGINEECGISAYTHVRPNNWKLNGVLRPTVPSRMGVNKVEFIDGNYNNFHFRHIQNLGKGNRVYFANHFYIDQHYNPDVLWMSFHNVGEQPLYKLIENVSLNENFAFPMSDLTPMESFIDFEIPQSIYSSIYVGSDHTLDNGIKPNFRIFVNDQYEGSNTIRAYYPANFFLQYYFRLFVYAQSCRELMEFKGAELPITFQQIAINESVESGSIQNFSSTISGEADFVYHIWENVNYDNITGNKVFRYQVYSPISNNFVYSTPSLPTYVAALNPDFIDLTKLTHKETGFSKTDNTGNYSDFINQQFVNPEQNQNYVLKLTKEISY